MSQSYDYLQLIDEKYPKIGQFIIPNQSGRKTQFSGFNQSTVKELDDGNNYRKKSPVIFMVKTHGFPLKIFP